MCIPSPTTNQSINRSINQYINRLRKELDAQHNWGMTLLGLERFEEAGLVFEEVVNQDPMADESWASLGITMAALDQNEAALACQKQVLTIRTTREKKM